MEIRPGDVIFYTRHSFIDGIVSWFTKSPYVHVDVYVGDGTCIGAIIAGVKTYPVSSLDVVWVYRTHATIGDDAHLQQGLSWLVGQVGSPYSWADIALQPIRKIATGLTFAINGSYDCSELVTRFLMKTGDVTLGSLEDAPECVTPGALYSALFALPPTRMS